MEIIPGKLYNREQIAEMRESPELRGAALQGYVLRLEDGMFSFVHYTQASGGGIRDQAQRDGITPLQGGRVYKADVDWSEGMQPIVRRTPTQRVDHMMAMVGKDIRAGKVLTRAQIESLVPNVVAQAWKDGRTEITGEVVRAVVASMLRGAEVEAQKFDRAHVVRNFNKTEIR